MSIFASCTDLYRVSAKYNERQCNMKATMQPYNQPYNPLNLNNLGGVSACRNVLIHIQIQSLPPMSSSDIGGRLLRLIHLTYISELLQ